MEFVNDTTLTPAGFFLTGIPGLEDVQIWFSIPFCLIYVTSVLGTSVVLFIIKRNSSLHEPMYIFLSKLAITDLGISITKMLTTLRIFLFNSKDISHDACFAQLFFIASLILTQSSVLLFTAFDRVVVISYPLRYATILTPRRIVKMGLVCLLRGVSASLPFPILLKQYQNCKASILSHPYCLNQEVMTMACSDTRVNIVYGFFVVVSTVGLDLVLILLCCTLRPKSLKALNTCVSHICVVLLSHVPGISLAVIYRFVKNSSPLVQNVMGIMYLLIPPMLNPVVHSVKADLISQSATLI